MFTATILTLPNTPSSSTSCLFPIVFLQSLLCCVCLVICSLFSQNQEKTFSIFFHCLFFFRKFVFFFGQILPPFCRLSTATSHCVSVCESLQPHFSFFLNLGRFLVFLESKRAMLRLPPF